MKHTLKLIIIIIIIAAGSFANAQHINVSCVNDAGAVYGVKGFNTSAFEWVVDGGEIVENWNDSVMIKWTDGPGIYTITVYEHTQYSCVGAPAYATVLVAGPEIGLEKFAEICIGETFEFEANATGYGDLIYQWHNGTSEPTYTTGLEEWVSVAVTDEYNCTTEDSAFLKVNQLPVVKLGADTIISGDPLTLQPEAPSATLYTWSTGDISESILLYSDRYEREIILEVTDENNCVNADTIILLAYLEGLKEITNVFTPNGDNVNDVWQIEEIRFYPNATIEVFDRWGRLVYRNQGSYDNNSNAWDGTDTRGNPLPMDSYYYVINLKTEGLKPQVGNVTLVR